MRGTPGRIWRRVRSALAVGAATLLGVSCHATSWDQGFTPFTSLGFVIWSGGDGAYSVPVNGTHTLWLYGDSYATTVAPNAPAPLPFLPDGERTSHQVLFGNTAMLQQTPTPGTPLPPFSIDLRLDFDAGALGGKFSFPSWLPLFLEEAAPNFPPSLNELNAQSNPTGVLHWPAHGTQIGSDLVLFNTLVTGTDIGDESCVPATFKVHGSTMTVIPDAVGSSFQQWGKDPLTPLDAAPGNANWDPTKAIDQQFVPFSNASPAWCGPEFTIWGTYVYASPTEPGTYFIYGYRQLQAVPENADLRGAVVARVQNVSAAADLADFSNWKFLTETGWSDQPTQLQGIAPVETEFSVMQIEWGALTGQYALISSGPFPFGIETEHIRVYTALAPEGPWSLKYTYDLKDCPNSIPGHRSRAAKGHAHLSHPSSILVSYIVEPDPEATAPISCVPVVPGAVCDPTPPLEDRDDCFCIFRFTRHYTPKFVRIPWDHVAANSDSSTIFGCQDG